MHVHIFLSAIEIQILVTKLLLKLLLENSDFFAFWKKRKVRKGGLGFYTFLDRYSLQSWDKIGVDVTCDVSCLIHYTNSFYFAF